MSSLYESRPDVAIENLTDGSLSLVSARAADEEAVRMDVLDAAHRQLDRPV
jgi:hypothetical protein